MTTKERRILLKGIYRTAERARTAKLAAERALADGAHDRWLACHGAEERDTLMHDTLVSLGHSLHERDGGDWIAFDSEMEAVTKSAEIYAAIGERLTDRQIENSLEAFCIADDDPTYASWTPTMPAMAEERTAGTAGGTVSGTKGTVGGTAGTAPTHDPEAVRP